MIYIPPDPMRLFLVYQPWIIDLLVQEVLFVKAPAQQGAPSSKATPFYKFPDWWGDLRTISLLNE